MKVEKGVDSRGENKDGSNEQGRLVRSRMRRIGGWG